MWHSSSGMLPEGWCGALVSLLGMGTVPPLAGWKQTDNSFRTSSAIGQEMGSSYLPVRAAVSACSSMLTTTILRTHRHRKPMRVHNLANTRTLM